MNSKHAKYKDMAETGIPWLGQIPASWASHQITRAIESSSNGVWGSEPDGKNDTLVVRVADFDRAKLQTKSKIPTFRKISESEFTSKGLKAGDLLLEKSGGGEKQLVGMVVKYQLSEPAVCSNFVAQVRPKKGFHSDFLNYAFSHLYAGSVNEASIKQATGIQNLDSRSYLAEKFCFPAESEQKTIAAFLDYETAKIDELIAKQKRLIALLKEKRQAVISSVIDDSLPAPKRHLRHHVEILPGYAFPSAQYSDDANHIRLLRGINIGVETLQWKETKYWNDKNVTPEIERFYLKTGDIVFGMDRPWISAGTRVAMLDSKDLPALLLQRVCSLRARSGLAQQFLYYCLASTQFRDFVESDLTGVSVPHISADQIKAFPLKLPPLNEQLSQVEKIAFQVKSIDRLSLKSKKAIALAQERRSALISAAVTGKIDVRGWVAPTASNTQ